MVAICQRVEAWMVNYSDKTLQESDGDYVSTAELMGGVDTTWMIRATVSVSVSDIYSDFVLHFWNDGHVDIIDTTHPADMGAPDNDLRELNDWCRKNGWNSLCINSRNLKNRRSFDYWMQIYRSGIVESDFLRKRDEEETHRLVENLEREKEEEEEELWE